MIASQLFNAPASTRKLTLYLLAYKNNRIASKLIKLLKSGGIYIVIKQHSDDEDLVRYSIQIESNRSTGDVYNDLKNEIINYIPDNFPSNYQFDFTGEKLGFIKSFNVLGIDGVYLNVSHRIKEMNKNSIMPEKQIFKGL